MRKRVFLLTVLPALAALLLQLPASWARPFLSDVIKPQMQLSGSVWRGRVTGDGFGAVEFQTHPIALLTDGKLVTFQSQAPGFIAKGGARAGRISDVSVNGLVNTFSTFDSRLGSLKGDFNLQLESLEFDEACEKASGTVSTNVLASNFNVWRWQGPPLSGPVSCENGDLLLSLYGVDEEQGFDVDIRLKASGTYSARVTINTRDSQAAQVLPLFGFEQNTHGFTLMESGRWQ